jgi:hypothetical protein
MKQNVSTVGIDLAKKIFHLVRTDTTGKIVWRKRLTRHALMPFMAQLPPVTIGLEACGGAHYWARQLRSRVPGPNPTLTLVANSFCTAQADFWRTECDNDGRLLSLIPCVCLTDKSEVCSPKSPLPIVFSLGNIFSRRNAMENTPYLYDNPSCHLLNP